MGSASAKWAIMA